MSTRQILVLAFQSITLGAGMALGLAGAFHSRSLFFISLPFLAALVFYVIKPWPGDATNRQ